MRREGRGRPDLEGKPVDRTRFSILVLIQRYFFFFFAAFFLAAMQITPDQFGIWIH